MMCVRVRMVMAKTNPVAESVEQPRFKRAAIHG